ncbi:hypothetical protein Saso_76430 [Streptomyces asoensis]|uniref:Uncharacterized protein n=1 Tax=Streptomyces asoensis TaxID=249586 RepID=A0ABQ3SCY5_9ACTN|nr:hypothetical protein GCM10010496_65660 [Streptomyces asoensis]GHI65993.1 hypothetical protein Saso_76430 [Streptomyces asoensis]
MQHRPFNRERRLLAYLRPYVAELPEILAALPPGALELRPHPDLMNGELRS